MAQYYSLKLNIFYPFKVNWPMLKYKTKTPTNYPAILVPNRFVRTAKVVLNVERLITYYSIYDARHNIIIIYYIHK